MKRVNDPRRKEKECEVVNDNTQISTNKKSLSSIPRKHHREFLTKKMRAMKRRDENNSVNRGADDGVVKRAEVFSKMLDGIVADIETQQKKIGKPHLPVA